MNDRHGARFGRWTAVRRLGSNHRGAASWECVCDCGCIRCIPGWALRRGASKSCGCLKSELAAKRRYRHGHTTTSRGHRRKSPEYQAWGALRYRCGNAACREYKHYGARGIRVCDRWESSFEAFLSDMGLRPSAAHSIDRIDNNGNYEPGNCRWTTQSEQVKNRRKLAPIQQETIGAVILGLLGG